MNGYNLSQLLEKRKDIKNLFMKFMSEQFVKEALIFTKHFISKGAMALLNPQNEDIKKRINKDNRNL